MTQVYQRVVILGGAGAGKSTLARALGGRLDLPVTHLDRLCYDPGWMRVGAEEFSNRVSQALQGDRWVVEGTYHEASVISLPRADLVVWVQQPVLLRLWRAWRKTRRHRNAPRADRPDGCAEGFDLAYARTVLSFGRWTSAIEASVKGVAAQARVLCVRSDREVAALVEGLGA